MNNIEAVNRLAQELYEWEGRYGQHQGVLWKELPDKEKSPYLEEALFIKEKDEFAHQIDALYQKRIEEVFEEIICPMCYRLNPQHATMDNGEGCHWCQEKEDWTGITLEQALKAKEVSNG